MFGKKKAPEQPVAKPNKIKIEMAIEKARSQIGETLGKYSAQRDAAIMKIAQFENAGRHIEAEKAKEELMRISARETKLNVTMSRLDSLEAMIDEAFANNELAKCVSTVLGEANKITAAPEINKIIADLGDFQKNFSNTFGQFDTTFNNFANAMDAGSATMSTAQSNEMDQLIKERMNSYNEQIEEKKAELSNDIYSY